MPATNCVKDCCRYSVPLDELPPHIREANAKVVGAGLAKHGPNDHRHLPGIDLDNHRPYTMISFGAKREYGPEEGWQYVTYKRKGRKARRYREYEKEQLPELEVTEEDEY
jgi:hypothetical protein